MGAAEAVAFRMNKHITAVQVNDERCPRETCNAFMLLMYYVPSEQHDVALVQVLIEMHIYPPNALWK